MGEIIKASDEAIANAKAEGINEPERMRFPVVEVPFEALARAVGSAENPVIECDGVRGFLHGRVVLLRCESPEGPLLFEGVALQGHAGRARLRLKKLGDEVQGWLRACR